MVNTEDECDKKKKKSVRVLEPIPTNELEEIYRRKTYPDVSSYSDLKLQCTCCNKNIKLDVYRRLKVYSHFHLKVLLCKDCCEFYGSGNFSEDEDGLDKYCRWCGQGGKLYICNDCPSAFCYKCILRNIGRHYLREVEKEHWKCFFCDSKPLFSLRGLCWASEEYIEIARNKANQEKLQEMEIDEKDGTKLKKRNKLASNAASYKSLFSIYLSFKSKLSLCSKQFQKITSEVNQSISFRDIKEKKLKCLDLISDLTKNLTLVSNRLKDDCMKIDKLIEEQEQSEDTFKNESSEEKAAKFVEGKNKNNNRKVEKEIRNSNSSETDDDSSIIKKQICNLKQKEIINCDTTESSSEDLKDKDKCINDNKVTNQSNIKIHDSESKDGLNLNQKMPILRIRNVEEVNKAILENAECPNSSEKEESGDVEGLDRDVTSLNKVISNSQKLKENNIGKSEEKNLVERSIQKEPDSTISTNCLESVKVNRDQENSNGSHGKQEEPLGSTSDSLESSLDETPKRRKKLTKTMRRKEKNPEDKSDSKGSVGKSTKALGSKKSRMKRKNITSDSNEVESTKEDPKLKNEKQKKTKKKSKISAFSSDLDSDSSIDIAKANASLKSVKGGDLNCEAIIESLMNVADNSDSCNDIFASQEEKKKSCLKEDKKEKDKNLCSDSDEDMRRLFNMSSLKKKRKKPDSNSLDSISNKHQIEKKKSKHKKSNTKSSSLSSDVETDENESSLDLNEIEKHLLTIGGDKCDYSSIHASLLAVKTDSDNNKSEGSVIILSDEESEITKKKSYSKTQKSKDEENDAKKKKDNWKNNKLLKEKLSETDSSENERKWRTKKEAEKALSKDSDSSEDLKKWGEEKTRKKKSKKKNVFSSDDSIQSSSKESAESSGSEFEPIEEKPKGKRKRILRNCSTDSRSESSDREKGGGDSKGKGRKNIRKVLKEDSLEISTQEALKQEQERKIRIAERQKLYNKMIEAAAKVSENSEAKLEKLVLDFDEKEKKDILSVDKDLVVKMKPHQAEGIKFMWDACFESVKCAKKESGSGCILAHCMGLGKTFQVVSLVHTLLVSPETGVKTVLIVAPLSTVNNWIKEFELWLKDIGSGEDVSVFNITRPDALSRKYTLKDWHDSGGVMIMGYSMFRIMVNSSKKIKASIRQVYEQTLADPGPDLVVCDEGHVLKNESTSLSKAMSKLRTRRRIVLTGTPLQNNLIEYHCMVSFIKPSLLGTRKEFKNRFVNPIVNGQFEDSTAHDVKVMKRRAHVLHKLLDGIVQRKDYNVLTPYLPQKFEFVISLSLSEVQIKLYQHYLDNRGTLFSQTNKGATLFRDWQCLTRICAHPRVLLIHKMEKEKDDSNEEESEGSLKDFINDSDTSSSTSVQSVSSNSLPSDKPRRSRRNRSGDPSSDSETTEAVKTKKEWWSDLVTDEQLEDCRSSSKITLFFSILRKCEEIGDKILVFSQSLVTLNIIEYFLKILNEEPEIMKLIEGINEDSPESQNFDYSSTWEKGLDYFRIDGGTSADLRSSFISRFNNESNTRARLFLISTRSGGLGITLTGANRVIIFDASWNPSHDVQSLFRVYRFGQKKPCYIYRFLSKGTMEERIYERQVAKLSISCRVIDEQQVDRHFSHSDLAELYTFNPQKVQTTETPLVPKDRLMAELLQSHGEMISSYHQHDSLLENVVEEELNEEERRQAWQDFENEKNAPPPPPPTYNHPNIDFTLINTITSKLKAQNPNLNDDVLFENAKRIYWQYYNANLRAANTAALNSQGQAINRLQPVINQGTAINQNLPTSIMNPKIIQGNPGQIYQQYTPNYNIGVPGYKILNNNFNNASIIQAQSMLVNPLVNPITLQSIQKGVQGVFSRMASTSRSNESETNQRTAPKESEIVTIEP